MKKIVIDIKATAGEKFVVLNKQPLFEYQDNQKTLNIIGSKLTVISLLDYEKYIVKLPQLVEDLLVNDRDQVGFDNLEAVPYIQNGRIALSLKATGVFISK
ncbi:TPA: hypothetical protein U0910_002101 [Streptococcus suis 8830]|uniref:hypothetical protein n=1 Tax=Streptococcus suis TaxID=1307 RepID=UPI0004218C15|nr:hypothetical protein [Streptococcus suis]HEM3204028.1 hypothetical protein [Streptococcus suis 8830]